MLSSPAYVAVGHARASSASVRSHALRGTASTRSARTRDARFICAFVIQKRGRVGLSVNQLLLVVLHLHLGLCFADDGEDGAAREAGDALRGGPDDGGVGEELV